MSLSSYTKEFKYNFKIAYPVILGMLGHTLVGFVDNVMVGKVGITELGAAALGNTAIFIAMSFAIGFSVATTSLVAMNDEAGDKQAVQSILNHSMLLNIILSAVLFLLMFFVEPIMRITGQSEKVIALAVPYTHLVAFSLIPLGVFSSLKQFADGLSMTKYAMYVTLLANLINIFGNYLFIYGNWGCPKLGVLGAGVGTLISRIAMPIMLYYMLKYLPKTKEYVTHISFKHIGKAMLRKISNIGLPTGLQMIFETGVFSAAIWISGMLGENQLSANQIALNLSTMTFMVANGLGITAMIRVGNQLGAKNYANLRRVAISVFLLVLCTQVFFATLLAVLRDWLPSLYLEMDNAEKAANNSLVIAEAANLLLIAAIFQISDGLQVTALGALRGLQDAKVPMYITFIAYWLIAFPILYVLGVHTSLGNIGIWIGLLVGLTAAAVCLLYRFNRISLRLIKNRHKIQN
ncbi:MULTISPECIES: MATE family efflux transporter [Capnocytophaga]|uniref:MATE family efflux transporter n=1 Tax=Capnocytophaga TaxID=1016 RepID=UPI00020C6BDE|nr:MULTISPECIES: MATE family efflux transporter [unclassified Capnocytophaga]KHE68333.1 MATE efflux family protein [Capnocytophaga sp. oral taxon 329 str. F0087]QGS17879.1 MATE family efflux transporter [Capnocytophaga sp. FDAARGOS_737]